MKVKQFIEMIQNNPQKEKNFIQTIVDAVPVPVFYKNLEGKYLGLNRLYKELIGLEDIDVIGKTVFDFAPYEIALKYQQKDKELLENPQEIQVYEYIAVSKKDGKKYNVVIYKKVFYDENNAIAGIIGSALDITEIKKYQSELEHIAHYPNNSIPN